MQGGSIELRHRKTQITPGLNKTSDKGLLSTAYNIRSVQDPIGYTRAIPDPKHHGQAMRSSMRTEWIKSPNLEMQGLWSPGVFQKVLHTFLDPQDKVLSTRFHHKIKRKCGAFDKCKVRLVVQGQDMNWKNADGVGDYQDTFSPAPAASGFWTILSLATQLKSSQTMLTPLRHSYKANSYQATVTKVVHIYPPHLVMRKILSMYSNV